MADLRQLLHGLVDEEIAPVAIDAIALDSRQVDRGTLFIALTGSRVRGHDFIDAAIAAGAAAVVYDAAVEVAGAAAKGVPCIGVAGLSHKAGLIAARFHGEPSRQLFMVGVTGTNGKTSCSHFLAQVLDGEGERCAVIGTLGNGLWGSLHSATHTTPDAVTLQRTLADFLTQGARRVAMEVSSHALEQGRVAGVEFDVAVLTNLSRDHLDYHGDMAAYRAAKSELFRTPGLRYAVLNGDDPFGRQLAGEVADDVEVVLYRLTDAGAIGGGGAKQVMGQLLACDQHGLTLAISSPWGSGELRSPLLGRFNASNLLAVLSVLLISGIDFQEALRRLASVENAPGRMEHYSAPGRPLVVIDYAHTPDALEQVLLTLRDHCQGRLWLVFGCGGNRDAGKRPLMGAIAARLADRVVLTDDNPRHEDPQEILDQIRAGMGSARQRVIRDRADAIAYAIEQAAANDLVLVAGKGHEDYQQVGGERLPFSDREQVLKLLGEAA